jgi:hypothetical protein
MKKRPAIVEELADLPHVPISALQPFQGELKQLSDREYQKLKNSLLEHDVFVPFFVWQETGKLLDGHQRLRVFIKEGWDMDVPVLYISAQTEPEAKRKLLVVTSQYGRVTQDGWDEFTWDIDDAAEIAQFDALPFVFDIPGDDDELPEEWPEYDESAADDVEFLECPECGHEWPK